MTQIQEETADTTQAGWREVTAWLAGKRVTLGALALIAAQVVLDTVVLNRGFFQQDDFVIAGLAAKPFSLHLLLQNYSGHVMPGVWALAWGAVHAGGYDWGLWAGELAALQALTGLALLRALRTLSGNRMALLIPLGVFLFTPVTLAGLSWWALGVQSVPLGLALVMAVDQHVRYVRAGRVHNAVFAALWVVFGLAFFEKAAAIPLLLFALTSAYLVPAAWPQAMLATLRRHWIAWALYAAAIAAEIAVYLASLQRNTIKLPLASSAVTFGWRLLLDTFVPAAFGGPWRWTPTAPRAWSLFAFTSAPSVLLSVSWLLGALVLVASLWYRRRAWPAWVILAGWLVAADIVPIVIGRLAAFGTPLATQAGYVTDAAPVLAICLAIAFLPLRGERDAYRLPRPRAWSHPAAIGTAAAVFAASAAWSAAAYRGELHPASTRSYLATASAALSGAPPDAVIYPTQIPSQMALGLFGTLSEVQNVLAPLANRVAGQDFRWTATPTGLAPHLMVFDAQGRLHPATVQGPRTYPFRNQADCVLRPGGMRLTLDGSVYPLPFLMQIGYYAAQPVTLAVAFGGHQYQVRLPASPLAYAYLPVQGPGSTVGITPLTPDPKICIGTVTVGNVVASATATPVPAFRLPG